MSKIKDMKLRYKIGVGVVTGAAVVGMAGGAFAYFTNSGSGQGAAGVGAPAAGSMTITQDSGTPATGLLPGGDAANIAYTVTNNDGGAEFVHTVTVSLVQDTNSASPTYGDIETYNTDTKAFSAVAGCEADWFTISNPIQTLDQDIAKGGSYDESVANQGSKVTTIQLNDSGTNQNYCENAVPALNFSSAGA